MAALIGYLIYRFPGAVLGFVIGSLLDQASRSNPRFRPPGQGLSKSKLMAQF
jgi:hypothetical protein